MNMKQNVDLLKFTTITKRGKKKEPPKFIKIGSKRFPVDKQMYYLIQKLDLQDYRAKHSKLKKMA